MRTRLILGLVPTVVLGVGLLLPVSCVDATLAHRESGTFVIHLLLRAVGEERYDIESSDGGLKVSALLNYSDRGNAHSIRATLHTKSDYTPLSLEVQGRNDVVASIAVPFAVQEADPALAIFLETAIESSSVISVIPGSGRRGSLAESRYAATGEECKMTVCVFIGTSLDGFIARPSEKARRIAGRPDDIAQLVLRALTDERPRFRYAAPLHAKLFLAMKRFLPEWLFEQIVLQMMGLKKQRS